MKYQEVYARSISEPAAFWGEAGEAIEWTKKWDKVLDDANKPFYRWFAGGELNTCYNALDYHVAEGRKDAGGDHLRQPRHRHCPEDHVRELLEEVSVFPARLADLAWRRATR